MVKNDDKEQLNREKDSSKHWTGKNKNREGI